jgi:GNAT superfamily N-acetyltransferase
VSPSTPHPTAAAPPGPLPHGHSRDHTHAHTHGPAERTTAARPLDAEGLRAAAPDLADLLLDAVRGGASLGFPATLTAAEATAWWRARADAVAGGHLLVWAAGAPGAFTGTVSLALAELPNSRHRAEVAKLMVHHAARGRGLGRHLLALVEAAALRAGRTLLVLDTETGSAAERLYRAAGWTPLGSIPDYATDPAGTLRPTTVHYKHLARPADRG